MKILNFKLFLAESQKRIDGIKKIHTDKMADYIQNGGEIHDRGVVRHYHAIYSNSLKYPHIPSGEGRGPVTAKQVAHNIIDSAANADPDQVHHKHTEWIVNQWKKQHVRMEDFHGRVRDTLTHFMEHGRKLPNKDINSYKNITDLDKALKPHVVAAEHGDMADMLDKHPEATLIHKEPGLSVHRLDTLSASKAIRKCSPDNKWCTSREDDNNAYHEYHTPEDPLYVVHAKDKDNIVHHFQFHFGSEQFADENDNMHPPGELVKRFPKLKNVKAFKNTAHESAFHFMENHERQPRLDEMSRHDTPNKETEVASKFDGPHLDTILDKIESHGHSFLADHNSRTVSTLTNIINHGHEKHLDKLENHPNDMVTSEIANQSGNNPERLMRMSLNKDRKKISTAFALANHPGPHLENLMYYPEHGYHGIAARMANHPGPHLNKLIDIYMNKDRRFKSADSSVWSSILSHRNPKHWNMAAEHEDNSVRYLVALHGHKVPGNHLDKLVNDPVESIRNLARQSIRKRDQGENYNG